jgi:hypothetical protein
VCCTVWSRWPPGRVSFSQSQVHPSLSFPHIFVHFLSFSIFSKMHLSTFWLLQ